MVSSLAGSLAGPGVQQLLDRLEAALAAPLPDETRFYGWQPLPLLDFHRGMEVVGGAGDGRRFLDVGSGIGSKLFLAAQMGFEPEGVERHPPHAATSRRLFPTFPVETADAFQFDGYREFDVVFSYRPCVDPAEQDRLNRRIADRLAPGALFFSAGGPWPDWLEHVEGQVWRSRS